jgi:hypothetical protein
LQPSNDSLDTLDTITINSFIVDNGREPSKVFQ